MTKLKVLKIGAGLLIPLLIGWFGSCHVERARVAKKLKAYEQTVFDTESAKTALVNQKIGLELKVDDLKLQAKNKNEEYENYKTDALKEINKLKRFPKIEYVKIKEKIYVPSPVYELTYDSYVQCEKQKVKLIELHGESLKIWNDLTKAQRKIIGTHEAKDKVYEKRIKAADNTIKFLSTRYYSTMYLSLSVSAGGFLRMKHDMTADYGFELLTLRLGFNKDIFRIALDR